VLFIVLTGGIADGKDAGPMPLSPNRPAKDVMDRTLDYDVAPYRVRCDLRRKDSPLLQSRFQYEVSLEGFPRIRARFFRKNNDTNRAFGFRISFRGIVEYNSTGNGSGNNDFDKSKVVQQLSMIGLKTRWSPFACNRYPTATSKALRCDSTYRNMAFNPNLTLVLTAYLSPEEMRDARINKTLTPNMLKFDLAVNNWHYASSMSKLGFVFGFHTRLECAKSPRNPVADDPSTEGAVFAGTSLAGDQFGFSNSIMATATNVTYPLASSVLLSSGSFDNDVTKDDNEDDDKDPAENMKLILFTVDTTAQPPSLYWDPSVSMSDNGVLPLTMSGVVFLFVVVFGMLF
jgi:hypothetical protein